MAQVVETENGPMLTSKVNAHSLSHGDVITDPQTGEPHNLLTVLDGVHKGKSLILTVGHGGTHRQLWTTQNHPYRRVTGGAAGGPS